MNILSIDFDFFQNTSEKALSQYPDGVDLPTPISCITWAGHYATHGEILKSVIIDEKHFSEIKNIIENQSVEIPVLITNSHKHAYNFIKDLTDDASLVNIDLHHDMVNGNPTVDCGNWIGHLIKEEIVDPENFTWITRELSTEIYDITDDTTLRKIIKYDFDDIRNKTFDAIFLCRSDTWLPPHLDPYFNELVELCGKFYDVKIESNVRQPRKIEEIIKAISKAQEKFRKG